MPDVPVIVPWRPGQPDRERAWEYVRRWWAEQLSEPIIADREGPWSMSGARNEAIAKLPADWDLVVIADADSIVFPASLRAAIKVARETGRMVLPYEKYGRLSARTTGAALAGPPISAGWRRYLPSAYWDRSAPGGCVVMPRAVWEAVNGYDDRFIGWGYEDSAIYRAAAVLVGEPLRMAGWLYHFWHQRMRPDDMNAEANMLLWRRYRDARTPDAMQALVREHGR